jgi:hypothetical protein
MRSVLSDEVKLQTLFKPLESEGRSERTNHRITIVVDTLTRIG